MDKPGWIITADQVNIPFELLAQMTYENHLIFLFDNEEFNTYEKSIHNFAKQKWLAYLQFSLFSKEVYSFRASSWRKMISRSVISSLTNLKIHEISNILIILLPSNIYCSYGSVCLLVFVLFSRSLHPLISFCFACKRQGNNSKTARLFYSPDSTLSICIS